MQKNTNDEVVNTFVLQCKMNMLCSLGHILQWTHFTKLFGSTDLSDSHTSMYPLGVVTV